MKTGCLIVCITSDDDGSGYWCETCPELVKIVSKPIPNPIRKDRHSW